MPGSRDAVIDLLGALSYAQLSGFEALAAHAQMTPHLTAKMAFARMAVQMFSRCEQVALRLEGFGVPYADAMAPFVTAIDNFHTRTAPSDWLEGILKAYVGDGIVRDFYTEMAGRLDPDNRDFIVGLLGRVGEPDYILHTLHEAIAADQRVAGRLALWARRIMGETLQQTQSVAAERDSLVALLIGGEAGSGITETGVMLGRLTDAHTARMHRLGLSA